MSITEFAPIGLPALGAGRIFFFPTIASLAAPKVTECTLNLTNVPDAGWEPGFEQAAGSHMKYSSEAEYEVPGKGKWTGQPMVYEVDPQDVTDASYAAAALPEGTVGYIGSSIGLDNSTALAATQVLNNLYPVRFGKQVLVPLDPSNDGQLIQVSQRVFITGPVLHNVAVVAGP